MVCKHPLKTEQHDTKIQDIFRTMPLEDLKDLLHFDRIFEIEPEEGWAVVFPAICECVDREIDIAPYISIKDRIGTTPLHWAACKGKTKMIQKLMILRKSLFIFRFFFDLVFQIVRGRRKCGISV